MLIVTGVLKISKVSFKEESGRLVFRGSAKFRNGLETTFETIGFKLSVGSKSNFYKENMIAGRQMLVSGMLKIVPEKNVFYLDLQNVTYNNLPKDDVVAEEPAYRNMDTKAEPVVKEEYVGQERPLNSSDRNSFPMGGDEKLEEESDEGYNENFMGVGGFTPPEAAVASSGLM